MKPDFEQRFTVYAVARRGRGETDATAGHTLDDESLDVESPQALYATDALAAVLPAATIGALPGQAHEGMTTAPAMYAEAVSRFLLD